MKRAASYYAIICLALLWPLFGLGAVAPVVAEEVLAELKSVNGQVDILRQGSLPAIPAKTGNPLHIGDVVRTKSNGYAELRYRDGSLLKMAPGSRLDIGEYRSGKTKKQAHAMLSRGKVEVTVDPVAFKAAPKLKGLDQFELHTPNCVTGVKGTFWFTSYFRGVTNVLLRIGTVTSYNPARPTILVTLQPNTITTITGRFAPTPPRPALDREIRGLQVGLTPPSGDQGGQVPGQQGGAPGGQAGGASSGTTLDGSILSNVTVLNQGSLFTTTGIILPSINLPTIQQIITAPPVTVLPPPPPPPLRPTTSSTPVTVNVNFN